MFRSSGVMVLVMEEEIRLTPAGRRQQAESFIRLKRLAEVEARKLVTKGSDEYSSFRTANKREPTDQDHDEFMDSLLLEWTGGFTPQEIDKVIREGVQSGPLGIPAMPSPDLRRGGGAGANWRPRQ